jgi:hypothetical protein
MGFGESDERRHWCVEGFRSPLYPPIPRLVVSLAERWADRQAPHFLSAAWTWTNKTSMQTQRIKVSEKERPNVRSACFQPCRRRKYGGFRRGWRKPILNSVLFLTRVGVFRPHEGWGRFQRGFRPFRGDHC